MERKRITEVIIALTVIIGLILVLWLLLGKRIPVSENGTGGEDQSSLPITNKTSTPIVTDPIEIPKVQEVSAGTLARMFVERIGSYSSESDYQNIDDVLGLVTDTLRKTLEKDAERARRQTPQEEGGYYGISTSYVGAQTIEESDSRITLLVQTQREESFGSPANATVRYQQIELIMVKEEDEWKVDSYTWKD